MEGKTSEQTNGPGALGLPLAWRHNFWEFYQIVVLGLVLPRIGWDRIGAGRLFPLLALGYWPSSSTKLI